MSTTVKKIQDILVPGESVSESKWKLKIFQNEDCISYVVSHSEAKEAIVIDPKMEDEAALLEHITELHGYRFLGVIDTHTHADHVSIAWKIAEELKTSYIMHELAPSKRVDLRVSKACSLSLAAGAIQFLPTPGHTADSLCVLWGPFLFTGDTVLYGDTGRDDLPTGDPVAHYESIQSLKTFVTDQTVTCLPGHDAKGGRASSWKKQLEVNSSLTQDRESFILEASAFGAPAPKQFKESLFHNFK